MAYTYKEQIEIKSKQKINQILTDYLPEYCKAYFNARQNNISVRTRLGYAYDLKIFFSWLIASNPLLKNKNTKDVPLTVLDSLRKLDFEDYLSWLECYTINDVKYTNSLKGKQRKLASLSTFFTYLFKSDMVNSNQVALVEPIKLRSAKVITRLENDEKDIFLQAVSTGTGLSKKASACHNITKERDLALFTVFLGTGIRVSELAGMDVEHIDFHNGYFKVIRKGGCEEQIYMSDEIERVLSHYLNESRSKFHPLSDEHALFLSTQGKRLCVRQIERITKKYASLSVPAKHITPHKMRSTFGTDVYLETGDINLVADLLGHSSPTTAAKSYVVQSELHKRKAIREHRIRESE